MSCRLRKVMDHEEVKKEKGFLYMMIGNLGHLRRKIFGFQPIGTKLEVIV